MTLPLVRPNKTTKSNTCSWRVAFALVFVLLLALLFVHGRELFLESISSETPSSSISSLCEAGVIYRPAGLLPFKTREEIPLWLEQHGMTDGAEIGVLEGSYSQHNLQNWPSCKTYHLIDLWQKQENYVDANNVGNAQQEDRFQNTKRRLSAFGEKTVFHRKLSTKAAEEIPDNALDFVYVDARHDYCGALEDIENYWPKLRPGGIMAGDDYITNAEIRGQDWGLCGDGVTREERAVFGAVNDFASRHGLTVTVTYWGHRQKQASIPNFIMQKPTIPECVKQ